MIFLFFLSRLHIRVSARRKQRHRSNRGGAPLTFAIDNSATPSSAPSTTKRPRALRTPLQRTRTRRIRSGCAHRSARSAATGRRRRRQRPRPRRRKARLVALRINGQGRSRAAAALARAVRRSRPFAASRGVRLRKSGRRGSRSARGGASTSASSVTTRKRRRRSSLRRWRGRLERRA